jgi:hypothetical protein
VSDRCWFCTSASQCNMHLGSITVGCGAAGLCRGGCVCFWRAVGRRAKSRTRSGTRDIADLDRRTVEQGDSDRRTAEQADPGRRTLYCRGPTGVPAAVTANCHIEADPDERTVEQADPDRRTVEQADSDRRTVEQEDSVRRIVEQEENQSWRTVWPFGGLPWRDWQDS